MLREQRYAAERQAELGRRLASATTRQEADAIRLDLAWARDDHERATARCAELRTRMADVDRRTASGRAATIRRQHRDGAVFRVDDGFDDGSDGGFGDGFDDGSDGGFGDRLDDGFDEPTRRPDPSPGAPAALTAGPHEPRPERPAGPYAAQDGAATSDWADARAHGAGAGGRHDVQGRSADPYAPRTAAGTVSDWPDPRAGDATAAHQHGQPRDPHATFGTPGTPAPADWPDPQRDATDGHAHPDRRPTGWATDEDAAAGHDPDERPTPAAPEPAPGAAPAPKQRKRRRGGARFAGMVEEEAGPVVVPPPAVPTLPAPAAAPRRLLRGARFGGAAKAPTEAPVERTEPRREALGAGERREVGEAVETLVRLRGEGRTGEAHALLVEAAHWPAARLPLLAAELQRAGLGADWATLLWETASLPADRLVAAADALTAAGRGADAEQILRQGVGRPADEIGQAVLGLVDAGRHREVHALLDAYVRVRTPEEAARSAAPGPQTLVPLLLQAARGVSDDRHWDLVHALRVAGFTA
jgi:hypothetical protein